MTYDEYLECAKKHLKSCQQLLNGLNRNALNKEAYLDIWYLSGYIIEGFTVYSVYKKYNWDPNIDIQHCNPKNYTKTCWDFYAKTKVDFYPAGTRIDKRTRNILLKGIDIKFSIKSHNFKDIIQNLLQKEPTFNDFPILGFGKIDPDVKDLINNWKPDIRYWYREEQMKKKNIPVLTIDLLKRLIETCNEVYKKMIFV